MENAPSGDPSVLMYPTAHELAARVTTPVSTAPEGLGTIRHEVPSQCSVRDQSGLVEAPTAQTLPDRADTPNNWPPAVGLGEPTTDQMVPSQCSVRVVYVLWRCRVSPTARMSEAPA